MNKVISSREVKHATDGGVLGGGWGATPKTRLESQHISTLFYWNLSDLSAVFSCMAETLVSSYAQGLSTS